MKATTVREINALVDLTARANDISEEEAWCEIRQRYEMICFMGTWDCPDAEVLVPDSMPVAAMRMPAVKVY